MKKTNKVTKGRKTKAAVPTTYDCCWYEPIGYDLCCGGVCGCC